MTRLLCVSKMTDCGVDIEVSGCGKIGNQMHAEQPGWLFDDMSAHVTIFVGQWMSSDAICSLAANRGRDKSERLKALWHLELARLSDQQATLRPQR